MLTGRTQFPRPDIDPDFDGATTAPEVPQSGASAPESAAAPPVEQPLDHYCQICPTCGNRLAGHRCKLICNQCGYYLSCADYY